MNRPDRSDTIAAPATPPGRGGVGIIRVSGPRAGALAKVVLGECPPPRRALYRAFRDTRGTVLDYGLALFFPAPGSFTGEDVLELHGHGSPVALDLMLQALIAAGARLARPGEFSERAFLNDKIDLAQAEAIADLIEAGSAQGARAALRSLQGEFSRRVHTLAGQITELRAYIEAAIDFPDEEIDFLSGGEVQARLAALMQGFDEVTVAARQGCLLREGMTVVIAGRPNVGKSSLLNCLAGRESAIVTDIPGTTRDVLREYINLDGMPLHVIDTAGLREGADPVEQEGIRRAWAEIERADRILLLADDGVGLGAQEQAIIERLPAGLPVTVVRNKIDLSGRDPGLVSTADGVQLRLSAKTGAGLAELSAHLQQSMGYAANNEDTFTARRRHLEALAHARTLVMQGADQLEQHQAAELLAEDLRRAHQSLGEITGEVTSDDLLGEIFGRFCIGK